MGGKEGAEGERERDTGKEKKTKGGGEKRGKIGDGGGRRKGRSEER